MKKGLFPLVAIMLTFSLAFCLSGCSFFASDEETTTQIIVKTPLPTDITEATDENGDIVTDTQYSPEALAANTKTIFEYFSLNANAIKEKKASVSISQRKSIGKATDENGEALPISDNEYINTAITSLDSLMLHNDGDSIEYGESLADFVPVKGESFVTALTLDDVESATCVDNGAERTVTVTLKSPVLPTTMQKAFDTGSAEEALKEFDKAEKYLSVDEPEITYKNCLIIIKANVETDEITEITYVKTADVTTAISGADSLESIGTVPVIFNYSNNITYRFDYTDPATSTTLAES